ncbi:MAG: S-methyl-5-thioribose kinase, partial [Geminicoccaceae bacterium]
LDLKRALFEHRAASIQLRHTAGLIPELLHFDEKLYLIAMEYCRPHVIMRQGMIDAVVYPRFADHIVEYLATTLFHTSDMALPAAEKRELVATFSGNVELCKITEDLIFTDPYMVCSRNRWTSPQLDGLAAEIRGDAGLKRAISGLKLKFLGEAQALLHGDLHTGSIMVTVEDTKVIDPEFAVVGPIGFDVGKLLGNLLLCHFSQRGHEHSPGERDGYRRWILATVEQVWTGFGRRFVELWTSCPTGDGYPAALFEGPDGRASLRQAQDEYMRELFRDVLGFAGAAMIRRTLGLAHNIDFERIGEPDRRADCERRNLRLARELLTGAARFASITEVTARATQIEAA